MATYRVTSYRASREVAVDAFFQCARCGFRSPVRVKGSGAASGQGSADMAMAMANGNAQQSAQLHFDLLRCPACQARSAAGDQREVRAVTRSRQALMVSTPLLLVALIASQISDPYTPLRTLSFVLCLGAVPFFVVTGWLFYKGLQFPRDTSVHATFAVAAQPGMGGAQGNPAQGGPQAPPVGYPQQHAQPYPQQPQAYPQQQAQPYPQQQAQPYPQQQAQPYPQPYPQQQAQPYPQQQAQPQPQPYPQQGGPPPNHPQGVPPQGRR